MTKTFVFNVSLIGGIDPRPCSRDLEVTGTISLYTFAKGIVGGFGFDFDHAFGFYDKTDFRDQDSQEKYELFADMDDDGFGDPFDDRPKAKSVKNTKVAKVFAEPGKAMQFVFDYGDEWRFLVELSKFGEKVPGTKSPSSWKQTVMPLNNIPIGEMTRTRDRLCFRRRKRQSARLPRTVRHRASIASWKRGSMG